MASFKVTGGRRMKGEITPQGAKNEALQILCAVVLTAEPVTIHNIPNIRDVNQLIDLLGDMGVSMRRLSESSIEFDASQVNIDYLESDTYKKKAAALRGSVMLLGPTLARFKKGRIPSPGGDKIGRRRLDTHFFGFMKLGAKFNYSPEDGGIYEVDASQLQGAYMLLDEASVTGTA
ncbi:MAG: UDP-N-acetylglucosamine 1-carboxyvinyltransferase, partial [Bacteroidota bacterium]